MRIKLPEFPKARKTGVPAGGDMVSPEFPSKFLITNSPTENIENLVKAIVRELATEYSNTQRTLRSLKIFIDNSDDNQGVRKFVRQEEEWLTNEIFSNLKFAEIQVDDNRSLRVLHEAPDDTAAREIFRGIWIKDSTNFQLRMRISEVKEGTLAQKFDSDNYDFSDGERFNIGRGDGDDTHQNQIVIIDPTRKVSRKHAYITFLDGSFHLCAYAKGTPEHKNYTRIYRKNHNSEYIDLRFSGVPHALHDQDKIQLGKQVTILVEID